MSKPWLARSGRLLLLLAVALAWLPAASGQSGKIVYRLAAFDKISISVYGEPDLSCQQLVSDNGTVFVPLLGPVAVGGLTVSEASELIERSFVEEEYLRKPVVTISIEEFAPKVVTVLGEVEDPGSVVIPPGRNGLPIQIAIAEAGGFTGTAKSTAVNVTRSDPASSRESSREVNVDRILQSRDGSDAFIVHAGDVVFVPRRVF
jgi:polysaccharide export outer membrane protein